MTISALQLVNSTLVFQPGSSVMLSAVNSITSDATSTIDVAGTVTIGQGEDPQWVPFSVWSDSPMSSLNTTAILGAVASLLGVDAALLSFVDAMTVTGLGTAPTALRFRAFADVGRLNFTRLRDFRIAGPVLTPLAVSTQTPPTFGDLIYIRSPVSLRGAASRLRLQSLSTLVLMQGFSALEGTVELRGTLLLPRRAQSLSHWRTQATAVWTGTITPAQGQADIQIGDTIALNAAMIQVPTTILATGYVSGTGSFASTLTVLGTLSVGPQSPISVGGLTTFRSSGVFGVQFSATRFSSLLANGGLAVDNGATFVAQNPGLYQPISTAQVFITFQVARTGGAFLYNPFTYLGGAIPAVAFDDATLTYRAVIAMAPGMPPGIAGGHTVTPVGILSTSAPEDRSTSTVWIIPVAVILGVFGLVILALVLVYFTKLSATTYREPIGAVEDPVRAPHTPGQGPKDYEAIYAPALPYAGTAHNPFTPYEKQIEAFPAWEYPPAVEVPEFAYAVPQPSPFPAQPAYYAINPVQLQQPYYGAPWALSLIHI